MLHNDTQVIIHRYEKDQFNITISRHRLDSPNCAGPSPGYDEKSPGYDKKSHRH